MPMRTKKMQLEYQREWLRERRLAWLRENGPCVRCGSDDRLEVDHIDPRLKVSHRVWSWSEPRRKAELAKCQVLCRSCHLAKTAADIPITPRIPGRWKKYARRINPRTEWLRKYWLRRAAERALMKEVPRGSTISHTAPSANHPNG